jgi:predicted signal transduction protein with EAL and GGDEF domain
MALETNSARTFARALRMTVVAEGVETSEQETFLRNHACDEMQGFLFSEPIPPRQLAELLRSGTMLVSPRLQPVQPAAAPEKIRIAVKPG